ncbi:hypothetical protein EDC04DRAFT_2610094 [Pisolithus marmoratus]|nr:hypothetical protein EDC04DRAFT_2610094 [Pisolithus marmoratus]
MAICEAHTKLYNTLVLISQVRWGAVSNRQQLMRSVTRHEAMLYSLRVPRPKVVTRMADAIVIPISKPFGQVPKHKADDDAIELPAKRSVARSFSINHDMLPESKPLLVSFGRVPKRKVEGDSPGPPPKKRAIKSPSTCRVMPQECCLWRLPNELLFDIVDLLDTDSLRRLSQVCKLLQDVSGRRYLAAVGFKLLIAGWLDVNEAGCVALPVWRRIAFRAVDIMWFTSSRTICKWSVRSTSTCIMIHHAYLLPSALS